MAQELIQLLDFELMIITPMHIIQQLFATGLIFTTDYKSSGKDVSEKTLVKIKEYALQFCEAVQDHYTIVQKFQSSKVAAVCIYQARKCC